MTSRRSVVVSGDLGSGKSTVSELLAAHLGLPRVSMGDLHRKMAQERGMSALQLNLHAERDQTVDDHVDQLQAQMARSGDLLVVDSRLAWFFFTDAFKVHLVVDQAVGAQRVMSRPVSEVESYASLEEAVSRLRDRADSERMRFIRKYKVDKGRLRNYDMICDSSRARPEEICDDIIETLNGDLAADVITGNSPFLILDPSRIYPSRDTQGIVDSLEPGYVADVGRAGHRALEPISVAYCDRYFFVVDGHRRLSAALRNKFTLIPAQLVAEGDESVVPGLSACEYFRSEITKRMIYDWEVAHGVALSAGPGGIEGTGDLVL